MTPTSFKELQIGQLFHNQKYQCTDQMANGRCGASFVQDVAGIERGPLLKDCKTYEFMMQIHNKSFWQERKNKRKDKGQKQHYFQIPAGIFFNILEKQKKDVRW